MDRAGFVKVGTFFRTDVAVAGVGGLRNVGNGVITLSGVSGTINRAFLYWHAVTNSTNTAILATISVDGQSVTGTNIGLSSDNCWGFQNSQAYVADVTTLVRNKGGNGTYALTGMGSASPATSNGASLIVLFQDGTTSNDHDVVLYHGNDSNIANIYDAAGWDVTLAGITYSGGPASIQLHVADGQTFPDDAVRINGQVLVAAGNVFQGTTVPSANNGPTGNGSLWDIREFNLAPFLVSGNNDISVTTGVASDCLSLITALVSLPSGAAPTPPFIFVPSTISLTLSSSLNVYLFSTADFNAVNVSAASTRLYIGSNTTGAPVAPRGTAFLTATGDYNGDGRIDRLMTFRMVDLIAAGLTTSSTQFTLADRTGTLRFEGHPDVAPTIVP